MNNTSYKFLPIFFLPQSSCYKLYVTSENSLIPQLLKCLPPNATKQSVVKILEHKLEKAFSDGKRVVQLGPFILLSVPNPQQLPRLTSLYFFSFLN